jgi:hypothetical protein
MNYLKSLSILYLAIIVGCQALPMNPYIGMTQSELNRMSNQAFLG